MSNILKANLYLGIGSLIYIKAMLDGVKDKYDKIILSPRIELLEWAHPGRQDWIDFKDQILKLFFSEPPYELNMEQTYDKMDVSHFGDLGIPYVVPDLRQYLCKGTLPTILENIEYVVLSTKVRWFYRDFYNKAIEKGLWDVLNELGKKFKIVIIGEREVEKNMEYKQEFLKDNVYCLYDDFIKEIDANNIIDLSIPAYGISEPSLTRLQNDCIILSNAKFSITFGIGGNFCMSTAITKTIGLNDPKNPDEPTKQLYSNCLDTDKVWITQDIDKFFKKLKNQI